MQKPLAIPMVVFTNVDGVLRDPRTHSLGEARAALQLLVAHEIPVVLVSQQPAAELLALQDELRLREPFVCDRGRAVHIPQKYFGEPVGTGIRQGEWEVVAFPRRDAAVDRGYAVRFLISLYRQSSESMVIVGLADEWSDRALLRQVDVPVVVRNDSVDQVRLRQRLRTAYFTHSAGPAGWSEAILGSTS